MQPVTCVALVPDPYGNGEVVVRAYECLRLVGITPAGYATVDEPLIVLKPRDRKRAWPRCSPPDLISVKSNPSQRALSLQLIRLSRRSNNRIPEVRAT